MAHDDPLEMTAAASTLGWKSGEWPKTFTTDAHTWTRREETTTAEGEVLCANYEDASQAGTWLIVYND